MKQQMKWLMLSSILCVTACKTQEEIQREQVVDNISIQMVENQKLTAGANIRLQNIEEKLGMLTGQVEDTNHSTKEELTKQVEELKAKITLLEEKDKSKDEKLEKIEEQLKQQDSYLKKLLKTLSSKTSSKKSKKKTPYQEAMSTYSSGNYKKAQSLLSNLESNKRIKGGQRARVLHNLGMSAYINKNNNDATVAFGKLFTEFPKSNYNANGLLYLSKTLKRLKQNEQAKQTLQELIKRFPKSKRVKEAKSILAKL
ncbi:tol-pal system YbgF family protein [Halobacteriovorax sp.]|uniref:tetratricopeptide repeat protein n=1 Tax=Halobacteriovorax sp. TaxID=2020862 RepID=UPI003562CE19